MQEATCSVTAHPLAPAVIQCMWEATYSVTAHPLSPTVISVWEATRSVTTHPQSQTVIQCLWEATYSVTAHLLALVSLTDDLPHLAVGFPVECYGVSDWLKTICISFVLAEPA